MIMISKNEGDDGMRVLKRPQCQRREDDPPKMFRNLQRRKVVIKGKGREIRSNSKIQMRC
jgi:hypothetical protein